MKALAIGMAAIMGLLFVTTELVQAQRWIGYKNYCKSGAAVKGVKNLKQCKENGGTR